ncbi:MAG: GIY-YIG nuclease family protein [Acidimicrobiia bacterium]
MRQHAPPGTAPQILTVAATLTALAGLSIVDNTTADAACWALIAAICGYAAYRVHNAAAGFLTPWRVYMLLDRHGDVIYIGSTNHAPRRFEEHLADIDMPWKRQVRYMANCRNCWGEKQARRIEERRIKALTIGVEKNVVKVLHNDLLTRPADNKSVRWWRLAWLRIYRIEAWLHPSVRWVSNPTVFHPIDLDPTPANDTQDTDPAPSPDAEPATDRVEASYECRPADRPDTDQRMSVPLLALSPVPMSPCPPPTTPYGGGPRDRGQRGQTQAAEGTTLAARIRAAHQRQRTATNPKTAAAAGPVLTAAQADAKRRWDEREKKRRQRAKQAGESYTKLPWPGDLPS